MTASRSLGEHLSSELTTSIGLRVTHAVSDDGQGRVLNCNQEFRLNVQNILTVTIPSGTDSSYQAA